MSLFIMKLAHQGRISREIHFLFCRFLCLRDERVWRDASKPRPITNSSSCLLTEMYIGAIEVVLTGINTPCAANRHTSSNPF